MILNVTYDAITLATAPSGFFSAVNYVVSLFDTTFTNAATVNIEVGYGDFPYDGSQLTSYLGLNQQNNVVPATYAQVRQALVNEGAPGASTLPVTSPLSGQLELGSAQEKALGLIGASSALDGWVGIASDAELQQLDGTSWSFSPTAIPTATQYYIIGVIEHEFTELMGRSSYLDIGGEYGVIDLYRYAAANVRQTGTGDPAYFSINNGVTNLDSFNNPFAAAGDLSDWAPNAGPSGVFKYAGADAFDNNSLRGQINAMTATDLTLMAALGWGAAAVSPPPPPPAASPPPPPVANPVTTGDFNDDGKSDILWQYNNSTNASDTHNGDTVIWLMNGTSVTSSGSIGTGNPNWHVVTTGDFNGDGKSDILWQYNNIDNVSDADNGDTVIWLMNGTSVTSSASIGTANPNWHVITTGDFNGNGKADILWQYNNSSNSSDAHNGDTVIWLMNGTSVTSSATVGTANSSWHPVATDDFNGDGKSDILWQYDNKANASDTHNGDTVIWLMDGTKESSSAVIASGSTSGANWDAITTGDFNGDGKPDILWQYDNNANALDTHNGDTVLWLMKGTSFTFADIIGTGNPSWHPAATGDFNGDGKSDILWQYNNGANAADALNGAASLWLMNGSNPLSQTSIALPPTSWHVTS